MTERDRGLTVAQAKQIAGDPKSAPGVLNRLANGYPEVWQILLANPSTPSELRDWLQNALKPKPPAPAVTAKPKTSGTDETLVVERLSRADSRRTSTVDAQPAVVAARSGRAPHTRRRTQPARGSVLTIALTIVSLLALGAGTVWAVGLTPVPGIVVTQELADEPSTEDSWTYDLLQGQQNADCIEWSFQSLSQDMVVVLSQYSASSDACTDLEEKPETYLALVNSATGAESWRINVNEMLSWTDDWSKDLTGFTGLNEIVVKFTDTSEPGEEDPLQTLVPFNRLDGSVTDAVVARSESDPVITAPHIEVGRVPWSDRNIVVGFPASDDDRRLSLRRAKSLTEDKWNVTTPLEPISGNPIVDHSIILGSEYEDVPNAVDLESGKERIWNGPVGGKLFNIAGSYVHVSGDGTKERVSNSEAQGGKAETEDCDAECITLTGISVTGQTIWQKKVPGYALARDPQVLSNATRANYSQLFVVDADRNSATRINPATGEPTWSENLDWGDFEVSKVSAADAFFTFQTTADSDHADKLQVRSLFTGSVIGEYDIPNDQTRVDGLSAHFAYLIDEPDRSAAIDDIEAGNSVDTSSDEDEESDPAGEIRVCMTAINMVSQETAWTWSCNGYQHVVLAAGNWVVFDKTPGKQTMMGLRVSP